MAAKKQNFNQAIHRASLSTRRFATAFKPEGGSVFTMDSPGYVGYIYVRMKWMTLAVARDEHGLNETKDGDASVWVERDTDNTWRVTGYRYEAHL